MIEYERTCYACPEQYDAFYNGEQVGYLRLRHGHFTVVCPDCGGELVYEANPAGDGIFDLEERDRYLTAAALMIEEWLTRQGKLAPKPKYVVKNASAYKD